MKSTSSHRLSNSINTSTSGRFCDIKVPDALRTILPTGDPYLDALFTGQGIRPSTCCMITGLPGGGKTTLSLQLANSLAKQGHTVVFNSCEENDAQIKMKLEKMNFDGLLSRSNAAFFSSFYDVKDILAYADQIRSANKPPKGKGCFLFIDSLQTIERHAAPGKRGRPSSPAQQQTDAVWDIAAWCKTNMTVACIVGQVTKDGSMAGKQEIKHAIDVHLELNKDTDRRSETYGKRTLEATKNRLGPSGIFFPYEIDSSGITFLNE